MGGRDPSVCLESATSGFVPNLTQFANLFWQTCPVCPLFIAPRFHWSLERGFEDAVAAAAAVCCGRYLLLTNAGQLVSTKKCAVQFIEEKSVIDGGFLQ